MAGLPPLRGLAAVVVAPHSPARRATVSCCLGLAILYVSYPLGRYLYHHGMPRLGTVLEYGGGIWMGSLVLLLSALGLVDLVTLFGLVLKPWVVPLRTTAIGVALVLAVVAWFGGFVRPRTVELEVELPNLPAAADGLVVAHLTDLHLGALIGERRLRSVIEQIGTMNPDLVVVTGDLVDGDAGTVENMVPALKALTAPLGVYSILGNHEIYAGPERCRGPDAQLRFCGPRQRGGRGHARAVGRRSSGQRPRPRDRWSRRRSRCIAHRGGGGQCRHLPPAFPRQRRRRLPAAGAGLMLNGHTHGGQIWPFHYMVLRAYPHLAGVRKIGDMTQVVSRGAGRWGRTDAPSSLRLRSTGSPSGHPTPPVDFSALPWPQAAGKQRRKGERVQRRPPTLPVSFSPFLLFPSARSG